MDSGLEKQRRMQGERVLRLLVEQIQDYALFALDKHGCIMACNSGAAYTLGYPEDELYGLSMATFLTHEDRAAEIDQREMRDAVAQGRALDERWHVRKDGSRFWALGITIPIREPEGTLIVFGKQLHDALENQAVELARASEDKSVFIATLAHELRTPLSALKQCGELLGHSRPIDRQQLALNNAVKFSDRGMQVTINSDSDGEDTVIQVLDRGAGIPQDQMASIFELFSQARNASVGGDAGLGIGLALTRDLVSLHGGTIQARSEGPGKGSEFTVRLPLVR